MAQKPATAKLKTVVIEITRTRFTNEGFTVGNARTEKAKDELLSDIPSMLTFKMFAGPAMPGQRWVLVGDWITDPKYGVQFEGKFAALATPRTTNELKVFILSGMIEGWGWEDFYKLTDKFGNDACTVVAEQPHRLESEAGITPFQYESLLDAWQRSTGLAVVYSQLTEWGIGTALADRLVKEYKFQTVDVIKKNPYTPIADVPYYTWRTGEQVAAVLELEEDDPRRVEAGLAEVVRAGATEQGHTWMTNEAALKSAESLLGLDATDIDDIMHQAVNDDSGTATLVLTEDYRLYPGSLWYAEQAIAASVARRLTQERMTTVHQVEALTIDPALSEEQQHAVVMALLNPISMLTGGPGVGKTSSIKALVAAAQALRMEVHLMAPTGKAAQRMMQATGHEAQTIHRAFGLKPGQTRISPKVMPLTGLVVVDEVSMLDTVVAAALFAGISHRAHVLLVGDPDQLPSVGAGAVLRDILESDVLPRMHLTRVFRNEAGIAVNAARIRAGESILSLPDCKMMSASTAEQAQGKVMDTIDRLIASEAYSRDDILVLCPTNDGASGRHALNTRLQAVYNGDNEGCGIMQKVDTTTYELRVGDRVIVTKNNSELEVFNGETGRILQILSPKRLVARIEDREVTFGGADLKNLQLAYAITGHKAQGSEAPVVIAPIFQSRVLSREWFYTIITRARSQVYLVGDPVAMQNCINVVRLAERRTGLVDSLRLTVQPPEGGYSTAPYAWSATGGRVHTRRESTPWKTSCGIDSTVPGWTGVYDYELTDPCKRCLAAYGQVVQPFKGEEE